MRTIKESRCLGFFLTNGGKIMNKHINLNRLEYIVTYQCSSKCIHCFFTDEEKGSPKHIDTELAVQILRDVGRQYALESVMTFGGEPLLYPEVVCAIHQEATKLNIPSRQVITNGYWSKDRRKTRSITRALARAGVNNIAFSVDAFHQEHVPLEHVKLTATALLDAGIPTIKWNPCWLVSEGDDNEYNRKTRTILKELSELPIRVGCGNTVEPNGKALTHLGTYFQRTFKWSKNSCQEIPYTDRLDDIRSICVEPNGDIPACPAFMMGNATRQSILEILEGYNPYADPEMTQILEQGIEGVIHKARASGIGLREEGYYSICELCTTVRTNKTYHV
jgi:sulfatase maturation enzyme AslB (radical SAM superfamily)